MEFRRQITHSMAFATGAGARKLRWIAVCALVAAAASLAQVHWLRPHTAQTMPPAATLHGEAAVRQLKADGGYKSLAAALAAARYQINAAPARAIQSDPSGQSHRPGAPFYADNPRQQLRATFAPDEVRVNATSGKTDREPDGAELRLRLAGYGYGEQLEPLAAGTLTAHGDRIEIKKSVSGDQGQAGQPGPQSTITEWYVNKPEGLEQGFTISAPPAPHRAGNGLRVAVTVGPGWRASVRGDGQGAVLERRADGLRLGYDHLLADDAQGRRLPARMAPATAPEGDGLELWVDDTQAVYPLTIDPILTQQQKLTATDGEANDQFGSAVALSGNTAVIGAPFDDVAGADQGSVYVFIRSGAGWTQQQKLTANDGAAGDQFGFSVAISGDTLVVGAKTDANGTNAEQGSAYVFTRNSAVWTQQQKLTANDGAAFDEFGFSVTVSGDTAVVGAPFDTVGANTSQGSAYVFVRSGAGWTQQQKLTANDGAAADRFGGSVSLSGDTVAAGALRDTVGANLTQGSAYVFTRSGAVWTQQQKLIANDGEAGDQFGHAVALSGDTVVVGVRLDDNGANADQGAAYVFIRTDGIWTQQQKLTASDGEAGDQFGLSVAISGDTVVVGAFRDLVGTNTNQGSAYVFSRNGAGWTQQQKLTANDGRVGDFFGIAVAFSGDTVVVGAPFDDVGANADQGAAYVFVIRANNFVEQQSLIADDGAPDDALGYSVALGGDTLVVGAPTAKIGATAMQGSAYVFVRNGAGWTQQQKLTASDGAFNDEFGSAVAISGDTVVVGALFDDIGTNADQGSAYVFTRSDTVWTQQQKLTASDGTADNVFGASVAISGDTVVVGAFRSKVGLNAFQGAAYVFTRTGTVWTPQKKLTADDGAFGDFFGTSVAISGDTVVIGANGDDIGTNQAQGSAYVFTRSGAAWTQQQKLTANDGAFADNLGASAAISGDTVVIGAIGDDNGTNGDQGSAYVFTRRGEVWTQQQKLTADDGAADDFFGLSVAVSGDTVVVGAKDAAVGMNDLQGSAYVYVRGGTRWAQQQKLTASDGRADDGFGVSVAASGDTLAVGSALNDIGSKANQGSTYIFACPACPAIALNPDNLPGARVGNPYGQTVAANGGAGPYQFSVSDGALPPGLILAQNGQLSGTPTTAGAYRFTITATILSSLCSGSRSYTLTVTGALCPTVIINPPFLPAGQIGAAYSRQLDAAGGLAPYSFTLAFGSLPPGLMLTSGGLLGGVPTQTGTFNFTAQASDANRCLGTQAYSVTINDAVAGNGLQFYPLAHPVRLLDTRTGASGCFTPGAPIAGGTSRIQPAQGLCGGLGIPDNARAVTGNITTVNSGGGFLTLYPSDAQQPLAASSNYAPDEIVNNVFTVGLGADGAFKIFALNATDVVVDITGYFAPPGAANLGGLYFHPLPKPIRLLDTRAGAVGCTTPGAPLTGDTDTPQLARLTCDGVTIPDAAMALVGNATTVGPAGPGYLTLFPASASRPLAASSNYGTGQVVNGPFTVGLSAVGEFNIYTLATTHLVVDVLGYYSPDANDVNGAGLLFNPLSKPVRLLDTRAGATGCFTPGAPLPADTESAQPARGSCQGEAIPAAALAIVGNATTVNSNGGFLTFWPSGAARPLAATSNFNAGQVFNRHFMVGLGADGAFKMYSPAQTDLVVDVTGYFAP